MYVLSVHQNGARCRSRIGTSTLPPCDSPPLSRDIVGGETHSRCAAVRGDRRRRQPESRKHPPYPLVPASVCFCRAAVRPSVVPRAYTHGRTSVTWPSP